MSYIRLLWKSGFECMAHELCLSKGTIRCSPSADKSLKSRAEHETRESLQSLHVALVLRPLVLRFFLI